MYNKYGTKVEDVAVHLIVEEGFNFQDSKIKIVADVKFKKKKSP